MISSTTNYVEHPQLVAERICRYADLVGRERVIAGSDCGFGILVAIEREREIDVDHVAKDERLDPNRRPIPTSRQQPALSAPVMSVPQVRPTSKNAAAPT